MDSRYHGNASQNINIALGRLCCRHDVLLACDDRTTSRPVGEGGRSYSHNFFLIVQYDIEKKEVLI